MEKLKQIEICGKKYPIKIDLNVLEQIQEHYGSIQEFEMDIMGIRFKKDEEGKPLFNDVGNPSLYLGEPSIKAIKFVLPLMINEGLSIEAEEHKTGWKAIQEEEIFRNCDVHYQVLAKVIREEFNRCFSSKK